MSGHFRRKQLCIVGLAAVVAACVVLRQIGHGVAEDSPSSAKKNGTGNGAATAQSAGRILVVKPHKGGIPRTTTQPATMESFDFADLYAKISGYVKVQPVDIGDTVKAGQVLVEIDAPEFEATLKEDEAAVGQAEAQVAQMVARVATAKAEFDAAEANVVQVAAELEKATAFLAFREIQFQRISELFAKKSIEERRVDETREQRDAAQSAENSARAAILNAKAQSAAAKARIASAEADVVDARAKVRSAKAKAARAQVFVDYTNIVSPYNGVVTRRSFHVGDFIRAADQGGNTPLLTVARTDLMRVVVQVPDRDVPYTGVGDPAVLVVDTLLGEKFHGKVARFAKFRRPSHALRCVPNSTSRIAKIGSATGCSGASRSLSMRAPKG